MAAKRALWRKPPASVRRRIVVIAAVAMLLAAAMAVAAQQATRRALQTSAARSQEQLGLYANALQALIERYGALPAVLALDPELRVALSGDIDADTSEHLSRKLDTVNGVAGTSTLTLIDARGVAVAANNWQLERSNVGVNYAFRPYYQQAVQQGTGRFYGIGITTGLPGYFLSQAIRDGGGRVLGVIVVKIDLREIESEWQRAADVVLASDDHGIVFLTGRADWRYRELRALDDGEREALDATRQYSRQSLRALKLQTVSATPHRVRVRSKPLDGEFLWQSLDLPSERWQLHLLHDVADSRAAGRVAALATGGVLLSLLFMGLFLQQRLRLARLRKRNKQDLEKLVRQHAEALRTARDGVVQAAENATQQGRSLDHLPQGVSVIDGDLNLAAWNRRYVEIFRYPPELMRVGRPIEHLLRYNARRGLLGNGDVEDAVQRRLDHLRAATPYMFEREWDDGTVLEIRGNPLPDGGFVTAYADITAYRNTARELRTLAGALERRVDERTHDLDEARRAAERANRSKTQFVSAAVHDLLQPLNAARMFVSALRGKLAHDEAVALADHVDSALSAQDAILTSLLDIARLESGSIETQVVDLPLQSLFDTLARDFGLQAERRELRLRCVPTRAVVRSDAALLRRILQNFLSNALRYTEHGGVLMGCRRAGDRLRIEVWDSGIGIPEHQRAAIFEEFRRLDGGPRQHDGGAGLGLAIVDRIARHLGHRIGLRSWPQRGSVFWVEVPLGDAGAVRSPATSEPTDSGDSPLRGARIWSIDDDARVLEASRLLLEGWGCTVFTAASADDALAACRHGEAPDLLLLDQRLGERQGLDLTDALYAGWAARPPAILVSAERDAALIEQARGRGIAFLPKPISPPSLRALMRQLLLRSRGA